MKPRIDQIIDEFNAEVEKHGLPHALRSLAVALDRAERESDELLEAATALAARTEGPRPMKDDLRDQIEAAMRERLKLKGIERIEFVSQHMSAAAWPLISSALSAQADVLTQSIAKFALKFHKDIEGEYGCPGVTCPGVTRLIEFFNGAIGLGRAPSATERGKDQA